MNKTRMNELLKEVHNESKAVTKARTILIQRELDTLQDIYEEYRAKKVESVELEREWAI